MKAIYNTHTSGPYDVELVKVNPEGRDSGLFLAHIKFLEANETYPEGYVLTVGSHDVTVRGKTIHEWARQFNKPVRAKFEQGFVQWLWLMIGKPIAAECIEEPRGYRGLEGYQNGDRYMALIGSDYCKVYPVYGQDYCEICTLPVFKRFFKEV